MVRASILEKVVWCIEMLIGVVVLKIEKFKRVTFRSVDLELHVRGFGRLAQGPTIWRRKSTVLAEQRFAFWIWGSDKCLQFWFWYL